MTKVFYISLFSFFCFNAQAQTLSFETEEYDFGDIAELGGAASYRFVYTNTGHKPLIINSVHTSCGCTSPAWSSEPVLPQSQGFVDVTFDPRNRQGGFTKSIIVKSNGGEKTLYSPHHTYRRNQVSCRQYTGRPTDCNKSADIR